MGNYICVLALLLAAACATGGAPTSTTLGGQPGAKADGRPVQTGQKVPDGRSNAMPRN